MERKTEPELPESDMGEESREQSLAEGEGPSEGNQGPKKVPVKRTPTSRP